MPRRLKFTIYKVPSGDKKRYRIWLPARFSASGKRTALYYDNASDAREQQAKLQEKYLHGILGSESELTSAQVRDVTKAYDLIKESGIAMTLADAVTIAIEQRKARMQGMLVSELLEKYRETVTDTRQWSTKQKSNWRFYSNRFIEHFGSINIADLTHHALRDWIDNTFKSPAYFNSAIANLSPAFTWAVKQELMVRSPFSYIERKRIIQSDGVDVFTVAEAKRLLASCRDYRISDDNSLKDDSLYKLDCTDCLLPFAFLLFAGIRPDELVKLTWDNIRADDGYIYITPTIAKRNQVRHIIIMDNLYKFIETIPKKKRIGQIVPRNWKRKAYLVRKVANLNGRHDTARHSFASYFAAINPDVNQLRENMGHSRNSDMLFKHYRAAVSKKDAREYFEIYPNQNT